MTQDDRKDEHQPPEPVEQSQDLVRLRRAYQIACLNITELGDQRQMLVNVLSEALHLMDQLLTEMRLANVAPSAGVIVTKASFDQTMRKLLGHVREEQTS